MSEKPWYERLREPFPAEMVGKLPRKGVSLDYVGHGAVTSRLLEVDPEWNWRPLALDENNWPRFVEDDGYPVGLWIALEVKGIVRWGYGSVPKGTQDAEKQLIGDAIRNAAMRFGVALDLWIKGHVPNEDERAVGDGDRVRQNRPSGPKVVNESVARALTQYAERAGLPEGSLAKAVHDVTAGRTSDPAAIYQNEYQPVKDLLDAARLENPQPEAEHKSLLGAKAR